MVRAAVARGLTHLAITDHDRIDGAHEARAFAAAEAPGVQVIVGQEIRTTAGDLIGLFLEAPIAPGLSPAAAIAAVREQGGLVGIAHPFDRFRGSLGRGEAAGFEEVAGAVDWIEAWNARLIVGDGNARAAALAKRLGVPGRRRLGRAHHARGRHRVDDRARRRRPRPTGCVPRSRARFGS